MLTGRPVVRSGGLGAALLLVAGCSSPPPTTEQPAEIAEADQTHTAAPAIDVSRSLAVTDLPTLGARDAEGRERFSLARVLAKLASNSGTNGTGKELYRRIFDTNNDRAHAYFPDGQHCDDQRDPSGRAVLNGVPVQCPRQEGALADMTAHDPFCSGPGCGPYSPIAIVNRFDLAPANGKTCGQYRIVFGKGAGQSPVATAGNADIFNRNLIIFEAVLPNPNPALGLPGCAPVVEFWAHLSALDDPAQRAAELDRFYFQGLPGFRAVLMYNHYTGDLDPHDGTQISGQIRTNQFLNGLGGQMWQLREYNVGRACRDDSRGIRSCDLRVRLVPPKVNPSASFFDDADQSPAALAFRSTTSKTGFLSQVASLALPDLNLLNMNGLAPRFNAGQSTSSPSFFGSTPSFDDTNYLARFDPQGAFAGRIQAVLGKIGSPLTPLHIVRRAQSQACSGCHELATSTASFFGGSPDANQLGPTGPGALVWPDAALIPPPPGSPPETPAAGAFTQTSEVVLVPLVKGVTCDTACTANPITCPCAWALSPAMTQVFLPFRRQNMVTFLARAYDTSGTWVDDWAPAAERMKGCPDN